MGGKFETNWKDFCRDVLTVTQAISMTVNQTLQYHLLSATLTILWRHSNKKK